MPEGKEGSPAAMNRTAVERKSDRELVVTRTFNAPAHIVFEAWSKPELFKRWWVPKSAGLSLLSCDMDVRTGGARVHRLHIQGRFQVEARIDWDDRVAPTRSVDQGNL